MTSPVRYPANSLNIGDSTDNIKIRMRGGMLDVQGLIGLPSVRSNDQPRGQGDGDSPGWDTYGARMITLGLQTTAASGGLARTALQPLIDKWALLRSGEARLEVEFPGQPATVMSYFGRPREIDEGAIVWGAGLIEMDATWDALDPLGYGVDVVGSAIGTSPSVITNAGNAS